MGGGVERCRRLFLSRTSKTKGVMVFKSNDEPSAITGREHSKRKMPV
jgi:hypothetical protein